MALRFDYVCSDCKTHRTNKNLRSFICNCGGNFHYADRGAMAPVVFDAYFDPTVGKYLTSYKQQEREGRKYVTPQHPKGLSLVNENKKFMREMAYIRKHKLDYIKMQYQKDTKNEPDHLRKRVGNRTFSFAV